jgi:hypothetical protein
MLYAFLAAGIGEVCGVCTYALRMERMLISHPAST